MTTAALLIQRTRRFVGDFPDIDQLGASVDSSSTTLTTSTNPASGVYPGTGSWIIQIDSEAMLQTSASASAATIVVRRGVRGSTAASHASGATILVRPAFTDAEYIDSFNSGINDSFPLLYQPVVDESTTTSSGTWEYTIPNLNSVPIPYLFRISIKETGDLVYRLKRDWTVLRGTTPKIKFRRDEPAGTMRIQGFASLPSLTDSTSSLSTLWPSYADDYLVMYAANWLLISGEAQRVRQDTGARDDREAANRAGSSMNAANALYQRARQRLMDSAMPPLPKHVVSTF